MKRHLIWIGLLSGLLLVGCTANPEPYESDGTPASASKISAGQTQPHPISAYDDASGRGIPYDLTLSQPGPSLYLPSIMNHPMITLNLIDQAADGEIWLGPCLSWDDCHSAAAGNSVWNNLPLASVGTYNNMNGYRIKRIYLFFDTTSIPATAVITDVVLNIHFGLYQQGLAKIHVVPSQAGINLPFSDFGKITYLSGGTVIVQSPYEWTPIQFNATALSWILKGGTTKLALIQDSDLNNTAPSGYNDTDLNLFEKSSFQPYLTIRYYIP